MKKILCAIALLSTSLLYGTTIEEIPALEQEVIGVNKEQLEEKKVNSADTSIEKTKINENSSEDFIKGTNVESEDKVKVIQNEKSKLENEVTRTTPTKKSGGGLLMLLLGVAGAAALIIAL